MDVEWSGEDQVEAFRQSHEFSLPNIFKSEKVILN